MAARWRRSRGVRRVWPSEANFLLVEFDDAAAPCCGARTRLACCCATCARRAQLRQAVRISVGSPEQNDRLLASLA